MLVKGGYNLIALDKKMEEVNLESDEKLASGSYSIFREYLINEDI